MTLADFHDRVKALTGDEWCPYPSEAFIEQTVSKTDAFRTWLGKPVPVAVDWLAGDSWAAIEGPGWALNPWVGKGYTLVLGVPMFPPGCTLGVGASGAYDPHFTKLGQALKARPELDVILRPGWEFGGNWYIWHPKTAAQAADYAAYFRRIVTAVRSVRSDVRFDWNGVWGWQDVDPALAYPGSAYVDYIGFDLYDQSWISNYTDPAARWYNFLTAQYGGNWWAQFAAEQGKPLSIPEWALSERSDGHGGGDAPYFIDAMADWIAAHNVAYHAYFDYDMAGEKHALANFPLGKARYKARFG